MVGIGAAGPAVALQAGCLGLGEGWRFLGGQYAVGPTRGAFPEGGVRLVPSHTGELQLVVDPRAVPAHVHHLVFVTHSAMSGPGGPMTAAAGRMRLASGGGDTAYMDLDAVMLSPGTTLLLAELKRHGSDWWLGILGRPYPGGIVQLGAELGIPIGQLPFPTPALDHLHPAAGAAAYLQAYQARVAESQQQARQPHPQAPPRPTAPPPAGPNPALRHDGHGNAMIELPTPPGASAVIAEFTPGRAGASARMQLCDSTGQGREVVYSSIAGVPGRGLFRTPPDNRCRLRVDHEGPWSVALFPIEAARSISPVLQGHGGDVLRWDAPAGVLNVQYNGLGSLVVDLYDGGGQRGGQLLHEFNQCTLRLPMPPSTCYLHVHTDGHWTFSRG